MVGFDLDLIWLLCDFVELVCAFVVDHPATPLHTWKCAIQTSTVHCVKGGGAPFSSNQEIQFFRVVLLYIHSDCVNLRFNNVQTPIKKFSLPTTNFAAKIPPEERKHPSPTSPPNTIGGIKKKCQRTAWDNWRMWPSTSVIWAEVVEVSESWFTVVALPNLLKRNQRRSSMFSCSEEDIHTLRHSTVCCSSLSSWVRFSCAETRASTDVNNFWWRKNIDNKHFLHFFIRWVHMTSRKRKILCAWLQE